jgi:hypothetical protein
VGVTLIVGLTLGVGEKDGFGVVVTVTDGVTLAPGEELTVILGVTLGVAVMLTVTLGVTLTLVLMLGVMLILGVIEGVTLGVTEGDPAIRDLMTVNGSQTSTLTNFTLYAENGTSTVIPETRSLVSTLDAIKLTSS